MKYTEPEDLLQSRAVPQTGGGNAAPELSTLENIGLERESRQRLCCLLDDTAGGVILIAGPASSGKTATLHAILNRLKNRDTIMVDEIREGKTAGLVMETATAGYLVLSAVRADSAASAIGQLINLGMEPRLLAGVVKGIVFQRLVRRLCIRCRRPYSPTLEEIAAMGMLPGDYLFYQDAGCGECSDSGYRGRVGAFEVVPVTPDVRQAICAHSPRELESAMEAAACRPIADSFRHLVLNGMTSTREIHRILECR